MCNINTILLQEKSSLVVLVTLPLKGPVSILGIYLALPKAQVSLCLRKNINIFFNMHNVLLHILLCAVTWHNLDT